MIDLEPCSTERLPIPRAEGRLTLLSQQRPTKRHPEHLEASTREPNLDLGRLRPSIVGSLDGLASCSCSHSDLPSATLPWRRILRLLTLTRE